MLNKYKNNNIQSRKQQNKTKKETNEPSILGFHLRNERMDHAGVQKNGKMSLKFCIIIESNSQKTFIVIVLYTNTAAVTSSENRELIRIW